MNALEDFACIRIINLPQRTDRRREMAEQLARVGLGYEAPNVRLFNAIRPDNAAGFDSVGARGCFMSHLEILREASGSASVLIFEDDLTFARDVAVRLGPTLRSLPSWWGVFYGGCSLGSVPADGALAAVSPATTIATSHFVGFNGPVIPRLVHYLEAVLTRQPGDPAGGPMHVDGAYSRFRADNPDVRTLVATPALGFQRPSRTDVHALKWFDRTPVVRDLVQFTRRKRARSS